MILTITDTAAPIGVSLNETVQPIEIIINEVAGLDLIIAETLAAAAAANAAADNAGKGWSPNIVLDSSTISGSVLMKLQGWIGGTGTAPTINVGKWLKGNGTYTAVPSEAQNIKPAGGGGGVELSTAALIELFQGASDEDKEAFRSAVGFTGGVDEAEGFNLTLID